MNINETTTLSVNITAKDANNNDTIVAYLNANLSGNMNFNINMNVQNAALVTANATTVKAQYDEFVTKVKARAAELGYVIF
jgi:hypothetical protein